MVEMYDDKKKKDKEEKDKISSMITKDSVKKEDGKEEEKPDMRSKYAMINLIKNKLRAAGQRDPMVMAVDACEERTPAKPGEMGAEYMENVKKGIEASKKPKPPTGTGKAVENYKIGRPIPKDLKKRGPKRGEKKGLRYNPGFDPSKASETTGP